MTFEEWWLSQPLDIRKMGPTMVDVKAAWDAATKAERERCKNICDTMEQWHVENVKPKSLAKAGAAACGTCSYVISLP